MTPQVEVDSVISSVLAAEKAVLGAILIDGSRFDDASEAIRPDDWYREAHRLIWVGMTRCASAGRAIDLITLRGVLTPEEYERVGGPAYVSSLTDGVPRAAHVGHYARQVREAAARRSVEAAARSILADAEAGASSVEDLLDRLDGMAQQIRLGQPSIGCVAPADRAASAVELIASKGDRGIGSGLRQIDLLTLGWRPGQLIVLGARPSQGKTSLALQMAVEAGTRGPVLFCSLEMSTEQITLREIALRSDVKHSVLDGGFVAEHNGAAVSEGVRAMAEGQIHIADKGGQTVSQIRSAARRLTVQAHQPLALIVVDYLQLMRAEPGARAENRTLEVSQFSAGLKMIAKDLRCPVLALSQLSRQSETRQDKRPMLVDLRDSGSIEQDADIVLLLHRPGVAERNPYDARAEVIVAKQRNGPTGIAALTFRPETMRFVDADGLAAMVF